MNENYFQITNIAFVKRLTKTITSNLSKQIKYVFMGVTVLNKNNVTIYANRNDLN